jgi:hypothetical protein
MPEEQVSPEIKKIMDVADAVAGAHKDYGFDVLGVGAYDLLHNSSVERDSDGEATGIKKADADATGAAMAQYTQKHLFMKVLGWSEQDYNEFNQKFADKNVDINGTKNFDMIGSMNGLPGQATLVDIVNAINEQGFTVEGAQKEIAGALKNYQSTQIGNISSRATPQTVDDVLAMHKFLEQFGVDAQGIADAKTLMKLYTQAIPMYAQMKAMQQQANQN